MGLKSLRHHNLKLPTRRGIYIMYDKNKNPIYVGRATNLRKRMQFYGQVKAEKSDRIRAMVSHVDSVDYRTIKTQNEAKKVERRLIHKYQPTYNVYASEKTRRPIQYK